MNASDRPAADLLADRDAGIGATPRRPRLGFLGVGWIGRHRLQAIAQQDHADIVAVADASPQALAQARDAAPQARAVADLAQLLELGLDGIVIATPSALHAQQAHAALQRRVAVFCQKPLARTAAETAQVVAAARDADRLLAVDLCYRHTRAVAAVRELIAGGELGDIYAVDLVFHNAYGPDKPWFRDPALSGGGCVIDLGIHLVDLALWTLGFPRVVRVSSRLWAAGRPLPPAAAVAEDHALAQLEFDDGSVARLACSWNLPAGRDAVIEAFFHGTRAGACVRNVGGSFYDFVAERYDGTRTTMLVEPPDAWGGRAICAWAARLARDPRFDPQIEPITEVAAVLDAIYGR